MGQVMDGASAGIRDAGCKAAGFSPLDPALARDFWPRIKALRESCPAGWSDQVWHERGDRGF
ncbi:hypothetical protein BST46_29690 [Mycobacterium timonense]|uniref:Uncharacterized protein n=1 Tax=Mycobacterium timonense TaxID=701043 RepID=A0ABX3TCL1_9MYCO|nr:hypothetical protein BST46_29690 [Mycobacterium timonense]